MNVLAETPRKTRSLTSLWVLIALFALPPMAAWLFFFNPDWLPDGRTNHGTLIDPPRPLATLQLQTPDGNPFVWDDLQGQWTMTLVSEGGCDAACIEALIEVRQLRRATGANRQRIERLLILLRDQQGRLEIPNLTGLEGTRVALADSAQRGELLSLFPIELAEQAIPLFLIDPQLDLMMTHDTSQIPAKQILQDLEKLLKASQGWVKGGQYGHQ
jgi:cytochrome oxidase Cu insertion factor (SCO1/SenC/PrrC family)